MLRIGLLLVGLGWANCQAAWAVSSDPQASLDPQKPRLVMVHIEAWKTMFFNLPAELPVLLEPGQSLEPHLRHYDFEKGMKAMMVLLSLEPQNSGAPQFRNFLKKWPLYQNFFQALRKKDYGAADKLLKQIEALDAREAAVHFYRGSLNSQRQRFAAAEASYQQSLQCFSGYGPTYIHLARLARARGAAGEAKQYLNDALTRLENTDQEDTILLAQKMLQSLEEKTSGSPSP